MGKCSVFTAFAIDTYTSLLSNSPIVEIHELATNDGSNRAPNSKWYEGQTNLQIIESVYLGKQAG
jgi:hypothetical protein